MRQRNSCIEQEGVCVCGGGLIHRRLVEVRPQKRWWKKRGGRWGGFLRVIVCGEGGLFLEVEWTDLSVYVKRRSKSTPVRPGWNPSRCFTQLLQNWSTVVWMCLLLSGLSVMKQPWELEWLKGAEWTRTTNCRFPCVGGGGRQWKKTWSHHD